MDKHNPLTLLFITDNYPPQSGGMARSAKRISDSIHSSSVCKKLIILTIDPLDSSKGIKSVKIKYTTDSTIISIPRYKKEKLILHELRIQGERIIDDVKPDLLIGFYLYRSGYVAALLGNMFNIPSIVSIRGNDLEIGSVDPLKAYFVKYALQHATAISSVTPYLAKLASAMSSTTKNKIKITFNGIKIPEFEKEVEYKEFSAENVLRVGFIGDNRRKKGFEKILDSILVLHEINPHMRWKFVIAGDLDDKIKNKKLSENIDLQYLGKVNPDEIDTFYNSVDCVVIPSLWEGFPNVLLETIVRKIPVLVSNVKSLEDLFPDSFITYVEVHHHSGIAKHLFAMRSNFRVYQSKASRAYDYLSQMYSDQVELQRWLELIGSVLNTEK